MSAVTNSSRSHRPEGGSSMSSRSDRTATPGSSKTKVPVPQKAAANPRSAGLVDSGDAAASRNPSRTPPPLEKTAQPSSSVKPRIDIHVKGLSGRTFTLDVRPNAAISNIKAKIEREENVPPKQQFLQYNGKLLDSTTRTIKEYGITTGRTVRMVTEEAAASLRGHSTTSPPRKAQAPSASAGTPPPRTQPPAAAVPTPQAKENPALPPPMQQPHQPQPQQVHQQQQQQQYYQPPPPQYTANQPPPPQGYLQTQPEPQPHFKPEQSATSSGNHEASNSSRSASEQTKAKARAKDIVAMYEAQLKETQAVLDKERRQNVEQSRRHHAALAALEAEVVKRSQAAAVVAAPQQEVVPFQGRGGAADSTSLERELADAKRRIDDLERTKTSQEEELRQVREKLDASEKKGALLAGRLVSSLRQSQVAETSELGFVMRVTGEEREAVSTMLESLAQQLDVELPAGGMSKPTDEGEMGTDVDKLRGDAVQRSSRVVANLHAVDTAVRQRFLDEQLKSSRLEDQLQAVYETAESVRSVLWDCAAQLMRERGQFETINSEGPPTAAERARSLGTTSTIAVGQSPHLRARGHDVSNDFVEPPESPDVRLGGAHVPEGMVATSSSLFDVLKMVQEGVTECISDLEGISRDKNSRRVPSPPSQDDAGDQQQTADPYAIENLRNSFEQYRRSGQRALTTLAERLDREVAAHHHTLTEMSDRVNTAEAEFTKLLLTTHHSSPAVMEDLSRNYREATMPRRYVQPTPARPVVDGASRTYPPAVSMMTLPSASNVSRVPADTDPLVLPSYNTSAAVPPSQHTSIRRHLTLVSPNL